MNYFKRLFLRLWYYPWVRSVRFFWQRMTRGWDDSQTWSLDYSLAKLILPRLKRFKELQMGAPYDMTAEEWQTTLDKMIRSFEWAGSEQRWLDFPEQEQYQEGINLFARYYFGLWW